MKSLPVLVAALVAAGVALFCLRRQPVLFYQDTVHYLSLGEHLARGDGFRSSLHFFHDLMQPPLYPLLIAAGIKLGGSALGAATVICLCAQAGTVVALVKLHTALWGERGRMLALVIAAVYPNLALGAILALEPLYVCELMWATWFVLWAAGSQKPMGVVAAGLLLGLALLTRSEALLSVVVLAVLVVAVAKGGVARRAGWLLALATPIVAVLLPYGFWMRAHLGYFEVLPKVRYNLPLPDIMAHMAPEPGQDREDDPQSRAHWTLMPDHSTFVLNYAFEHPGFDPRPMYPRREAATKFSLLASVRNVLGDAVRNTGLLNPLAFVLLLAAAWRGWREREHRLWVAAIMAQAALHLAPALASGEDYQSRYLAAALAFSVPLVSGGAGELVQRLRSPRVAQVAMAILLGAVYARHTWKVTASLRSPSIAPERLAAVDAASAELLPAGARVMANLNRYGYLRGGWSFVIPYFRDVGELRDYIAKNHVEFGIIDTLPLRKNPSPLVRRTLGDPTQWPPEWHRVRQLLPGDAPIEIVRFD